MDTPKGINHLAITVKNMEESLDFYTRVLGFKRVFDIDNPKDGKPWIVYLLVYEGQFVELFYGGETPNPWNSKLIGFNHICFLVDDVHAVAKRIKDAGWKLDAEPSMACDNNWQCWVSDPNGIRIEMMKISPDSPHAKYCRL
jgi:catechol 2,3-dioxygenase-like lactoylglutathione lyase family enzyme